MTNDKRNRNGRKPIGFLVFVLILLIGVVSVQISNLYLKNNELEKEAQQLEQEIERELREQKDLLEYKEYINSTEYIEQSAREKLGLIKPGEILFITKE